LRDELEGMRTDSKSSMPENLANELKNRQQFLDLLRYVIDIKERGPTAEADSGSGIVKRELSTELEGHILIQKLNCVACHQTDVEPVLKAKQPPTLKWSAKFLNPEYLQDFIADPSGVKRGTTMPSVLHDLGDEERQQAAVAITHFLVSLSGNEYQRDPEADTYAVARGFELFHSVGCVACHSPRNDKAIEQPLAGSSALGDISNKYNSAALVEFLEDPLAVRASGHMPNMQLTHKECVDIASYLLQSAPRTKSAWKLDVNLVRKGGGLFLKQDCGRCHSDMLGQFQLPALTKMAQLDSTKGCLAAAGNRGAAPKFELTEAELKQITAALPSISQKLKPDQQINVSLKAFNCIACHSRDDLGGVSVDRNPHFKTEDQNLGEQGRLPPTLTGVGAKLKPAWMRDVMVNGRKIRPYMNTRMPQFGEDNIGHLLPLFQATDKLSPTEFSKFDDQQAMRKKGHVLAGEKGLNCVACHTYKYKISDTMPAVDLTEMAERLKKDWFFQYMKDPQAFVPNTVMPSFWPDGKAIRADIEGDADHQVEALWQYLIDGRQARTPAGVLREPLEIVVTDEARLLRRAYPGIGKRGVGVGYPGQVNIAYDTEQMRLALIWKGRFVNSEGVWYGQGSGQVKPLGKTIALPKGPELDFANEAWEVDSSAM